MNFLWQGVRCKETLKVGDTPMLPTQPNIRHARNLVARIRRSIEAGMFDYAEYFPDSPRAARQDAEAPTTLGPLLDLYLKTKGRLGPATQSQYKSAAQHWRTMFGERRPIAELTHALVASKIGAYQWSSPKQHNNYLIVLRGALGLVYRGSAAADNPLVGVENARQKKTKPDPLSPEERDRILVDMRSRYDPRVYAYFLWQFYTGMRPEETIALRWSDVDERAGTVRVQRVRTFKGTEIDDTKTGVERDVDLTPQAAEALRLMRPYTFMLTVDRGEEESNAAEIFQRPAFLPTAKGGRPAPAAPWHDERAQRDTYWRPCLKRLGIRWRRPYNCRHTYATVLLMAGLPPAYIAAQLGHSVRVLLDKYAAWMPGAKSQEMREMLQRIFANCSPDVPRQGLAGSEEAGKSLNLNDKPASEVGRRDWTRTKK